jgi:hypothetical protein
MELLEIMTGGAGEVRAFVVKTNFRHFRLVSTGRQANRLT